jgi:multidrug efflux system outer membrane protein
MSKQYTMLLATAALALGACAVGPDYRAPDTPAAAFTEAAAAGGAEQPCEAAWWQQFGDPVLDDLIGRALAGDLDLKIAAARVEESRALLGGARRVRWPGTIANVERDYTKGPQPQFGIDDRIETESYSAGFNTVWELDLFGRVRRGVQAAAADTEAAQANLRDAQVLVAS